MSYSHTRQLNSHSLPHRQAAEDIKKGLERIKLAQIQVLRQLRKQDPDNHSLVYSKQTTSQSKPIFAFDGQAVVIKQKFQRFQRQLSQLNMRQDKMKKQYLGLAEDVKKYKELSQRSEAKLKEYEKGEQRILSKAQQAITNAINSQKKYISLKSQYDKTNKQRQNLLNQLKKLQRKHISELMTNQNQAQTSNKLVKQFKLAYQFFNQILSEVNNHRCQQTTTNSKKDSSLVNLPSNNPNGFNISTFELQSKLNKHLNNIILLLNNMNVFAPIQGQRSNNVQANFGNQSNNLISGSFRQDIRKIQEQLDQNTKTKMVQLTNANSTLEKKVTKLQTEINQYRQYKQQNSQLKLKIKKLTKELEQLRISRKIIQDQYQKFKTKTKQKDRVKTEQIQYLKKSQNFYKTELQTHKPKENKTLGLQDNKRQTQVLSSRIVQLQKQSKDLKQLLEKSQKNQSSLKTVMQSLKRQLELTNSQKNSQQQQLSFQMLKINAKANFNQNANLKNQSQWHQMLRTISKLQQERILFARRQNQLTQNYQAQTQRYKNQIKKLEEELNETQTNLEEMRKDNTAISYDQAQLTKFRNIQLANHENLNYNKSVDQLWLKKQSQYGNVNQLLGQISVNHRPQRQQIVYQNHHPNQSYPKQLNIQNNGAPYPAGFISQNTNQFQPQIFVPNYPNSPMHRTSNVQANYSAPFQSTWNSYPSNFTFK